MQIAQLATLIALAFLSLFVHRAGLARTLRSVGAFWFACADAVDHGKERYRGWVSASREMERQA